MAHEWTKDITPAATPGDFERTRAAYQDLGDWARHYSVVRMTVGTFFITAALGLSQLHWNHPDWAKVAVSVALFVFGAVLYGYFSYATTKRMNDQFKCLKILGTKNAELPEDLLQFQHEWSGLRTIIGFGLIYALCLACWLWSERINRFFQSAPQTAREANTTSIPAQQRRQRFPDFGHLPTAKHYNGHHFKLSQDYPKTMVADDLLKFLDIPFNENEKEQNWLKYLTAVRDYCFDGNIECDWVVSDNQVRQWYHVPWQHWGRNGREGIRGLTREATAKPGQLAPTQKHRFQTYAVAFYNPIGAYTIGRVWEDAHNPNYDDIQFEVGTVVCKLLFTQATVDQVPNLDPPLEWQAYAEISDENTTRKVQPLRLIQMDVMVRDNRALRLNGSGWVFGTYCYNGKLGRENKFENLVPVGIQWGNDPGITDDKVNKTPTSTIVNPNLKETIINPSPDVPPQHLGWNGRLNGPADYYASSCMSCHATAQFPVMRHQNPEFGNRVVTRGSTEWMKWFRNLKCGEPFSEHAHTTDFSLQLAIGIDNFRKWRDQQGGYAAGQAAAPIEIRRDKDD